MLEPARNQQDETSQARLWAEGTALSLDQAVAVALQVLSQVGQVVHNQACDVRLVNKSGSIHYSSILYTYPSEDGD